MKYGWIKASDCFIASVVLVLIAIAYGGCTRTIIREVSDTKTTTEEDEKDPRLSIIITYAPPDDPGENLAEEPITGKVQGPVNVDECKVVIYAYGNKWWVQPWANSPYTDIYQDGTWETDTHGGFKFAALLVKSSYKPRATRSKIPKVGGDVLAIAIATPKK